MNINDPFHATVSSLHGTVAITFTPAPAAQDDELACCSGGIAEGTHRPECKNEPKMLIEGAPTADDWAYEHQLRLSALAAIERLKLEVGSLKLDIAARNADIEQLRAPRERDRESLVDRLSVLTELDIECPRCGAGPGETCTWHDERTDESRSHLARMQANRERLHRLLGKVPS